MTNTVIENTEVVAVKDSTVEPATAKKSPPNRYGRRQKQGGFSLLELSFYFVVVAILIVISIPFVQGYIISGKVPTVSKDLQEAAGSIRGGAAGVTTATPYTGVTTDTLAAVLRDTSFNVSTGTTSTVTHSLQAPSLAPQAVTISGTSGATFAISLAGVHEKACPDLAAQMAKAAESITIGGTTVKAATANAQLQLAATRTACTAAGSTMVFTFR